jgi:uncharacterized protein with HEPN domain
VRDDRERLLDILEAIVSIERHTSRGHEAFDRDELVQAWTLHQLQTIGEAARGLSEQLRHNHPEVPWSAIITMRNYVVHEYFGVDLAEIWNAVERDLPTLRRQIEAILRDPGLDRPDRISELTAGWRR